MISRCARVLYGAVALSIVSLPLDTRLLSAQTPAAKFVDSARVEIDAATAARDTARLARAALLLERAATAFAGDAYVAHYRGYAAYRRALFAFESNDARTAAVHLATSLEQLSRSAEKLAWPETFALLASVSGMTIGVDPSRGMDLGPQVGELQGRAMQLGPRNPRVALIIGEAMVNTPAEWGGGADKARELLTRAVALFATDAPGPLAPSWGREEAAMQLKALGGAKSP